MEQELRREIKHLQDENQRLRDEHEPKIVELVGVAPAGPDQMLRAGNTADGRWISRIETDRTISGVDLRPAV